MSSIPKRLAVLLLPFAMVITALIGLMPAQASVQYIRPHGPVAFAVNPSRQLIKVGHYPIRRTIRVENVGTRPVTLYTTMVVGTELLHGGFVWTKPTAPAEQGTTWVTSRPNHITLVPNQIGHVTISVTIPRGHQPGEHFLGVEFYNHAGTGHEARGKVKTSENVVTGIVSELLLNTTGKVRVGPIIPTLSASSFSMGGPIKLTATVRNAGNVYYLNNHLTAVSGSAKVPFDGVLVLGDSARSETEQWTSPPSFGFPAHLTLMSDGKAVATASVWIVPVSPIAGALGLLVLLVMILFLVRKRTNRRIAREVTRRSAGLTILHDPTNGS